MNRIALALADGGLAAPDSGDVLVLRAGDATLADVFGRERTRFEQSFRPAHDAIAAAAGRVAARVEDGRFALAVVHATRSRAETLGDVARAFGLLAEGGVLALDGAKTDGIESLARTIAAAVPEAGRFVKAHGRVAWFRRPDAAPAAFADWAAAARPARTPDGPLTVPGAFSPEGPDPGSLRLAAAFDRVTPKGRVADLGAGWGFLSLAALAAGGAGVTAIDLYEAEARALDAARANLADEPRAGFHWADVTTLGRQAAGYDLVVTNPPFHQGRAAEPALGAAFIAAAARILKPGGRLLLVANRQLPYEGPLAAAFAKTERLSEDGAYKTFLAERPRRG
jgi:16S rRNA (guanine1207-N2)-methyltransferase